MFAIIAFFCFLFEAIGFDVGSLNLMAFGLAFLALQLVVGSQINLGFLTRRHNRS